MTLTGGPAPLGPQPSGEANFTIDAPAHRLWLEDYPHRLRAVVDDRVVLDSTRAKVLHETGHQIVPYVPLADFEEATLQRSDTTTHCPFKGDASYWSLVVGDRVVEDAVWAYEQPIDEARWLRGLAALKWDVADAWYVEDDVAFGPHLRDPYHRVDVFQSSRAVTVRARGTIIARTNRPKMLFETSLPVRVYVPRADVVPGVLAETEKRTQCPYKGEATYFSVAVDGDRIDDAAWSYETPLPEAQKVAGDVCFLADGIDVAVEEPSVGT
ncbi:MAG TPA: DUF427 domain-containing protein [Solirubrobacteraceae bacterium]|nr:DUF427 domain-containing protein [Solirubrobacteraceae bacterium]